jgi:hypothetical protein
MVLAHPAGDERQQRQPKQQMQIGPEHAAADALHGVQQVVMVVPVDADIDKAQDVAEENRQQRLQDA